MKTQSDNQLPLTQVLQGGLLINFNEQKIAVTNPDHSDRTAYEYDQVKVSMEPTKGEIVSAIIRSKYSIDDEFAITHNGSDTPIHAQELTDFMAFRVLAKEISTQILTS